MRRKRPYNSTIFSLFLVFLCALFVTKTTYAQEDEFTDLMDMFEPGTNCRKPEDPRLAAICGVVRKATPDTVDVYEGVATNPNPPLEGVSVYVYECYADSPTCKLDGALTNVFSSTSSDKDGYYYTTMRKVGNHLIRYLGFVCGGKLGGLYKIPSYASFTLNVPVNCSLNSSYAPPAESWNPVDYTTLSCDITRTDPAALEVDASYEGKFGTNYQPVNTYNFWLEIDGADGRYLKWGEWTPFDEKLNLETVTPTKGAFYWLDCLRVYDGTPFESLCYNSVGGETLNVYENRLYSEPELTTSNFLPNIPIKNSLLMFKDFTARQDVVNYSQTPTATAQLLHTIFSNCRGSVYLRDKDQKVTDLLPECDELKFCNAGVSENQYNYRNRQYSAGPARNLANPAILQDETAFTLDDSIRGTYVCQKAGIRYSIGDIQPPWSYCQIGESGCNFKLDKMYWNPEFAYFFGEKGTSTKVGYGFEGENDSFWPPATGTNEITWKRLAEKDGIPVKGGTYYSDNNYGLARNNGLTPMMAGIATTALSGTAYNLSYVLQRPFETAEDKAIYDQGIVKIEDAGSNIQSFCENSNVNNHEEVFPPNVADAAHVNSNFKGNEDHYFDAFNFESLTDKGELTPTSTIFYTTASKNRELALKSSDGEGSFGRDLFDSYLTSAYGSGSYTNLTAILNTVISAVIDYLLDFASGGSTLGSEDKTYYDRSDNYNLNVETATLRDDIKSSFVLSEENFEEFFLLPDIADGTLSPDDWGEWFDSCYQRNEVDVNEKCYQKFGVNVTTGLINRTCRVDLCELVTLTRSVSCEVVNGVVVENDTGEKLTTEACSTTGITTDLSPTSLLQNAMYYCATNKLDCYDGSWNLECLELKLDDDADLICPDISEDVYFPGIYTTYYTYPDGIPTLVKVGTCPDGSNWYDLEDNTLDQSCVITLSKSKTRPGCNMEDAGPYLCSGSTHKDANFKTTQETFRINTVDVPLDSTKAINNEMWKKLAHPFNNKVYDTLAFQSANTSVSLETDNVARNKNKDIPGFGGASPEYKMISAHALYSNIYSGGKDIFYHCMNTDVLNSYSGNWDCPLLDVPDPEIIDIFDDSITNSLKSSCQLNTDYSCISSYSDAIGAFSPTFIRVLDMAASTYNVPAAALLAYLAVIHKDTSELYLYLFSLAGDQALFDASAPWYGRVPRCDDTNIAAIGPYDWIAQWFPKEEIGTELDKLSFGRSETASRCNFLDATYAAAYSLASGDDCASYDWSVAQEMISRLALGFDRTGDYLPDGDDSTMTTGDYVIARAKTVWDSCR